MKRNFLARLRVNGAYYLVGALFFLLVIPIYQSLVLTPLGYSLALNATSSQHFKLYLNWISQHSLQFLMYRAMFVLAFALLLTLPFTLFRIIVAQEIMGQQERAAQEEQEDEEQVEADGMPSHAWRGKGFAVIAAWAGLFGLIVSLVGTLAGTLYLFIVSNGFTASMSAPQHFTTFFAIFSLASNTVGAGLLALATLFFGAMIARSGRNLWPGIWVAFGYVALVVAMLLSGSAVAVASAPTTGQAALTSPAIILFAIWVFWLGIMLIRLKPET